MLIAQEGMVMRVPTTSSSLICLLLPLLVMGLMALGVNGKGQTTNFFDLSVKDSSGKVIPLAKYQDKPVILVVNVAR